MQVDNHTPEAEQPKAQPEQEVETVNLEELQAEMIKLRNYNEALVRESKTNSEKYKTLRDTNSKKEAKELEESENWKALLDKTKEEKQGLTEQYKSLKVKTLRNSLNFEIAKHAKDAFEVDDIVNSLNKELISIDEDSFAVSGVADAVNELRTKKPYLFNKSGKTGMIDTRPGMNPPKKKGLSDMTLDQKLNLLKDEMLKANS